MRLLPRPAAGSRTIARRSRQRAASQNGNDATRRDERSLFVAAQIFLLTVDGQTA